MKEILSEIKDGKDAHEVVRKAKNMLLAKSLRMKGILENCCTLPETVDEENAMLITTV